MSENTKIEWCDHTFNPWVGCTKISPACDHCYAEGWAKRSGQVVWSGERKRTSIANWRLPLKWNREAEASGTRPKVFCASLADVFDNEVDPVWFTDLFELIEATPNLDWLLLTKRIGNVAKMVADGRWFPTHWPNVWIGATICNQAEADRDIPKLLAVPAAKRFLSMEPLLGPVDLTDITVKHTGGTEDHFSAIFDPDDDEAESFPYIDWVIVGGESGPNARPMHPDWARGLKRQCEAAGVPFLFKQWGEWKPISEMDEAEHGPLYKSLVTAKPYEDQDNLDDIYGRACTVPNTAVHLDGSTHDITEPMAFLQGTGAMQTFKVGKKAAGRLLDGREWNGVPA